MPNKLVFFMASFLILMTSTLILITSETSSGAKYDGNATYNPAVGCKTPVHGCCQVMRDLKNITQLVVAELLHMRTLNAQFNSATVESSSLEFTTSFPNLTLNFQGFAVATNDFLSGREIEGCETETTMQLQNSTILHDLDNKNKTTSAFDYWEAVLQQAFEQRFGVPWPVFQREMAKYIPLLVFYLALFRDI